MTDSEQSLVGDLINFRGLVYSPLNENGVVFLFGKVAEDLGSYMNTALGQAQSSEKSLIAERRCTFV